MENKNQDTTLVSARINVELKRKLMSCSKDYGVTLSELIVVLLANPEEKLKYNISELLMENEKLKKDLEWEEQNFMNMIEVVTDYEGDVDGLIDLIINPEQ